MHYLFIIYLSKYLFSAAISIVLACCRGTQQHESGCKSKPTNSKLNLRPDLSPSFLFFFFFPFPFAPTVLSLRRSGCLLKRWRIVKKKQTLRVVADDRCESVEAADQVCRAPALLRLRSFIKTHKSSCFMGSNFVFLP